MLSLKREDLEEVLAQVVKQGGTQRRVLTTQVFSQADKKGVLSAACAHTRKRASGHAVCGSQSALTTS